ncbi:MAG: hypothetical protein ACI9BD_001475 [Candidatus Marinamargulisbacteria bacterium]|jgi:hypothetical protein
MKSLLKKASKVFFRQTLWSLYMAERYGYNRVRLPNKDEVFNAPSGRELSVNEILASVIDNGYAVIPDFYEPEYVDTISRNLLSLNQEVLTPAIPKESEIKMKGNGLFWDKLTWSDVLRKEGIIRINHVDKRMPAALRFANEPLFSHIGNLYYGVPTFRMVTISQFNEPSPVGCRGYHIDATINQFKAFLYLTDVTEENGPFCIVPGSHRVTWNNMKRIRRCLSKNKTSITDEEVAASGYDPKHLIGKKGTVVLADTRAIHQGTDLMRGYRSALVNYYYLKEDFRRP